MNYPASFVRPCERFDFKIFLISLKKNIFSFIFNLLLTASCLQTTDIYQVKPEFGNRHCKYHWCRITFRIWIRLRQVINACENHKNVFN